MKCWRTKKNLTKQTAKQSHETMNIQFFTGGNLIENIDSELVDDEFEDSFKNQLGSKAIKSLAFIFKENVTVNQASDIGNISAEIVDTLIIDYVE